VQLEGLAPEQAPGFRPEDAPDTGARHPHVTALEDDPQLADSTGSCGVRDFDVRDWLQPVTAHVHHRR
jgi:hypothetical protein